MTISEGLLTVGLLVGSVGAFFVVTRGRNIIKPLIRIVLTGGASGLLAVFAASTAALHYRRCHHDWECIAGSAHTKEAIFFCRKCQRRKQENFMW